MPRHAARTANAIHRRYRHQPWSLTAWIHRSGTTIDGLLGSVTRRDDLGAIRAGPKVGSMVFVRHRDCRTTQCIGDGGSQGASVDWLGQVGARSGSKTGGSETRLVM